MAVRKPPSLTKEVSIEDLIDRGAPVKGEIQHQKEEKKWRIINLRISEEMISDVDEAVSERVGITRTGWILEAIDEKIKR